MKVSGSNPTADDPESLAGWKNPHCSQAPAWALLSSLRAAVLRNLYTCAPGVTGKVVLPTWDNLSTWTGTGVSTQRVYKAVEMSEARTATRKR